MKWISAGKKGFTPHSVFKYLLIAAVGMSALMALMNDYDRHPDESNHLSAVLYYTNHFLPPEIGDPAVRGSYSIWGVSYLNYHWVEYFLAGKFVWLISPLLSDPLTAARLFNVFLFAVLAALFLCRSRDDNSEFIVPSVLLMTPQIWYVFSYSNNDAFALFISFLIAYQIAYSKSWLNEFIRSDAFRSKLTGGIVFGVLAGILLICKPNYWVFLMFAMFWILLHFPLTVVNLKKYSFMALVAASVFAFRIGLDIYVNNETNFAGASYINYFFGGFEKGTGKLLAYQDEVAGYEFKPSTLENDLPNSRAEVKLRAKGTTLVGLFTQWKWHKLTFESFVGGYGYMNLWASRWYYYAMLLLYFLFGAYIFSMIVLSKDRETITQLGLFILGAVTTVFISVYLSWNYAFQPQGRYLFPIVGMLGLLLYANRHLLHHRVMSAFLAVAFFLSAYSFIFVALTNINGE